MSDANNNGRDHLLAILRGNGDFVAGDDGYWMFWPTKNSGGLSEWMVRVILEEIEALNEPVQIEWERRVNESVGG